MPPKGKPAPAPQSPPSSSGSESGSYATSDDEEDHQVTQQTPSLLKKPAPTMPPDAAANEASGSTDSSDSDSDESEEASDDTDSPPKTAAVSKPTVGTSKGKAAHADKAKPSPASESVPEKRKRRQAEDAVDEDVATKGPSAKKLFQRVWTEEDEIALLKGMIDFQAKHGGADPASAIDAFCEFIRRALHVEFSKAQLSDKMRRLRRKYETNLRRAKNGADPSFAKSHEQVSFELSKKLWEGKKAVVVSEGRDYGSDYVAATNVEDGGKMGHQKGRPGVAGGSPESTGPTVYPRLREAISLLESEGNNLWTGSLSRVLELLKPAKAKALEDQWNKHFMVGVKYMLERAELKRNLLKSIYKALDAE